MKTLKEALDETLNEALFSKHNLSPIKSIKFLSDKIEKILDIKGKLIFIQVIAVKESYRYIFQVGRKGLFLAIIIPIGQMDIPQDPNIISGIHPDDVRVGFQDENFRGVVPFKNKNYYTFIPALRIYTLDELEEYGSDMKKCIMAFK